MVSAMSKVLPLLAVLMSAGGCGFFSRDSAPSQVPAVEALMERSTLVRIACLDANADGRIDQVDATAPTLRDITGDNEVGDIDREIVRRVAFVLSQGRPGGCTEGNPGADWQVTALPEVDCTRGRGALVLLGVGGGVEKLDQPQNAGGVRWMIDEIATELQDEVGVSHQLASVAPGLNGTEHPQPDAEAWSETYLTVLFERFPCLRAVLLGHSHGGTHVTAVASQLENVGLGDRVLLAALVDRITGFYAGNAESIPGTVPVFNVYQTNDGLRGAPIERPNVENWDASSERGPEHGEEGGTLELVNHVTIDNSQAILDAVKTRILLRACAAGLCR